MGIRARIAPSTTADHFAEPAVRRRHPARIINPLSNICPGQERKAAGEHPPSAGAGECALQGRSCRINARSNQPLVSTASWPRRTHGCHPPQAPGERRPAHRDGVTAVSDVCRRRRKGEAGFGTDSAPSTTWRTPVRVQGAGWRWHCRRFSLGPCRGQDRRGGRGALSTCRHGCGVSPGGPSMSGPIGPPGWVPPSHGVGNHCIRSHQTIRSDSTNSGPTKPPGHV